MSGLAVKLPLARNSLNGFKLIQGLKELTRQNLKMLIMTSPGERMMDPAFGVGLKRYIFREKTAAVAVEIEGKIQEQINRYLPTVSLQAVNIDGLESSDNRISVDIHYFIPALNEFDILDFKFFTD